MSDYQKGTFEPEEADEYLEQMYAGRPFNIQQDAAMRMHSEAAKHVVCPECGCARGRHLGACSRG